MKKIIKNNVSFVGYIDWELQKFHGDDYNITSGSSQNSYLIEEEKTALIDTVWSPHSNEFVFNLKNIIDLKKIDYIIINHGEADHSGALYTLMQEIPETPIYCTEAAIKSLTGQYGEHGWRFNTVKTGDELDIGNNKKLIFIEMKMLHWPDSMATYLTQDNILFSMDAFGQHLATQELFNNRVNQELLYKEAIKYFANILNPFAPLITKKLTELKSLNLPIDIIAPSHGAIWLKDPLQIVDAYEKWSNSYQEDQITIAYESMWGATAKLAQMIADEINTQNPNTKIKLFNISKSDKTEVMAEVFKSRAIAVGAPTCLNSIPSSVSGWLAYLKSLKFKGKKAAAFGCYGWSGGSVKILQKELQEAGFKVADTGVAPLWSPKDEDISNIKNIVSELLN